MDLGDEWFDRSRSEENALALFSKKVSTSLGTRGSTSGGARRFDKSGRRHDADILFCDCEMKGETSHPVGIRFGGLDVGRC